MQHITSAQVDHHFFFLNNALVNSDPVNYTPGTKHLSGVDYNESGNSGYPSASGNFFSTNVSMSPFCSSARKTVYNFRQKTGLKYTRSSSDNFDDYTITVIIKLNTVIANTYYRILDFSNGQSDNGIYAYGSNLNFYPTGNIASNVFGSSQFTFLTITREAATKKIKVYVNDNLVTTYNDVNDYYKFYSNLIIARDNLPGTSAPNEDTNGQIAYINVKNSVSTDAQVKNVYDTICSLIPPNINAVNDTEPDANWQVGGSVLNIFDNDERENLALNPNDVSLTVVSSDPTGNITLNPDGTVNLSTNAPTGVYTLTYRICDNAYPAICDTAVVTVNVLSLPTVTSTTDDVICFQGFGQLSATASSGIMSWYDSPTGGIALGTGAIFTPPLTTTTTTYYVEVVDNWRVSAVREPVTLTVHHTTLPTAISPQTFCDVENATISSLGVTGSAIQWYATDGSTTPLLATEILVTGTYYATQTLNKCESPKLPVDVVVYETVEPIIVPYILESCDTNTDGDDTNGKTSFNLTNSESTLVNGKKVSDYDFYYFEDAAHTIPITMPSNYQNTVRDQQVIYVKIVNTLNNTCYTNVSFNLQVRPLPKVNSEVDLVQCDDDTDGLSPFNLTEANKLISTDHINENITYYKTLAQAENGLLTDQITNITTYSNTTPLTDVVYARVENMDECYRTVIINLIVGVSQIPVSFAPLEYFECDTKDVDSNNANGITTFNFSDAKAQIEGLFPAGGVTVTFYNNEVDALSELNAIPDIANHRNEDYPGQQDIYVRVDSDAVNACLGLGHYITLRVDEMPAAQVITDYVLCSDTNTATFNLTTKTPEVISTQTRPVLVSYHESEQDAINNVPIVNPLGYTATPRTIYIRAQFDDNNNGITDERECVRTDMSFNLVVRPSPVLTSPDPIHICSEQVETEYDLTIRDKQITNNDTTMALSYFETQQDVIDGNPIANPTTYLNTQLDRDIIVLAIGANMCTSTIILSLKTILYPNLNLAPMHIEECEVDNDGFDNFDLLRSESAILNGLSASDFIFTYYEQEADAIAGNTNAIKNPENFINTEKDTQTIYVRVKPSINECYRVVPVVLIVNPVPEIAIKDEYVICLNADNQSISPQLNTFLPNPPIDTMLSITEYSFQWYSDVEALPGNVISGATSATYMPTEAGYYTVIATDRITGCTIPATTEVVGAYPPESIIVELSSEAFSENNILDITVVGNGEYEYKLDTTDWQMEPRFERVRGGERIIYVRDVYNCNTITTQQVIIDYPKYFTPNGDGINDTWNIRGIDAQSNAIVCIYDRYGKLLKQFRTRDKGWNGTFKGNLMPANDYWFTVEYKEPRSNTSKIFKAHFTLKR
ncbi:T9SS type B sorting domain-containing protein [Snuella sedimenti]|uniref:T9SS type B sorting domain-containing protein n=1 Tax=Snuella sedimenti TaxID=2798802 RepID=A0A8J7J5M7_9FLAO|nr:T9SS type B sorting domain-containing protein [Snuella sedimenti]MBJ6368939.1 T9SS type B sorting domain-containing protein [Snuella sedimenti]